MTHIAVIGAGIAGLLPTYYLAKRGFKVTVYEQESYPAMRTSYSNGGQVSVSNSEVWTRWSNIIKATKWMLKKDAPLLLRPSLNLDKAIWLSKFLYQTAKNDWDKRTIETIKLGLESRKLYKNIIEEENLQFDQSYCGILHIYKDEKYFKSAKKIQSLYENAGCQWQILEPHDVYKKEPTLINATKVLGGVWTQDDWTGDIHKFCCELESVLRNKYDVNFVYDHRIDNILDLHSDITIIANGVESVKLAKTYGDQLPIYPVKGYSITIPAADINSLNAMPKVSLLDDQAKIVTSLLGTRLRVAGTAELADENYDIRRDRIEPLLNWVRDNFPQVNRKDYSSWACLRPMTPNMLPIVRQSRIKNVYYHVGHGHLGWTLSPATAMQLVNLIKD